MAKSAKFPMKLKYHQLQQKLIRLNRQQMPHLYHYHAQYSKMSHFCNLQFDLIDQHHDHCHIQSNVCYNHQFIMQIDQYRQQFFIKQNHYRHPTHQLIKEHWLNHCALFYLSKHLTHNLSQILYWYWKLGTNFK